MESSFSSFLVVRNATFSTEIVQSVWSGIRWGQPGKWEGRRKSQVGALQGSSHRPWERESCQEFQSSFRDFLGRWRGETSHLPQSHLLLAHTHVKCPWMEAFDLHGILCPFFTENWIFHRQHIGIQCPCQRISHGLWTTCEMWRRVWAAPKFTRWGPMSAWLIHCDPLPRLKQRRRNLSP